MSTNAEAPREPLPVHTDKHHAVDWEIPEQSTSRKRNSFFGGGTAISARLDRLLPAHKRYFGRSRRTLLIAIAVLFLLLLGLIIGLAVGLSKKSSQCANIVPGVVSVH
jgi:hypothetical protein